MMLRQQFNQRKNSRLGFNVGEKKASTKNSSILVTFQGGWEKSTVYAVYSLSFPEPKKYQGSIPMLYVIPLPLIFWKRVLICDTSRSYVNTIVELKRRDRR